MKKAIILLIFSADLFAYEISSPSALFPFPQAVLNETAENSLYQPGYAGAVRGAVCSSSYTKPYSMRELNAEKALIAYGTGSAGSVFSWKRFGIKEYYEDTAAVTAGFCNGFMSAGGFLAAHRTVVNSAVRSRYTLYDGTVHYIAKPLTFLMFGVRQDNIGSLLFGRRRDLLWPATSLGMGGSPMKGVFLSWNYYRSPNGAINTYGVSVNLIRQLSVSAGYARETTSYAVSASAAVRNIICSYSLNYHSYLGASHSFAFTAGSLMSEFSEVNVPVARINPDLDAGREIDINSCTLDELMVIKDLSEEHAGRMMRYRDIYGMLSLKALSQIGLSTKEITAVKKYAVELPEESEPEQAYSSQYKTKRVYSPAIAKKSLFLRLIENGLPSAKALLVSDAAMKKSGAALTAEIDMMTALSPDEKRKAKAVCAQ